MFKTASAMVSGFAASRDAAGKTASCVKVGSFEYEPAGPDYLYVSLRALSADRPNLNMDMFPSDELRDAHRTFVGSCVFLEHDNRDPEKSRGAIIASKFHEEDPDDKWVEILMELDERRCPKLCSMIRSGEIDTFSMGCNVEYSECPICGKKADQPWKFCEHMRNKGRTYGGRLAYEICHGIEFFEESVVYNPADPTARAIDVAGDRGDVAERTGEWFDELGTWVLEDPDGITLTADDNGFWFALDGDMNELGHGECPDKESAKMEADGWMRRRMEDGGRACAGRARKSSSRTAWKSRDLSQTDELRNLRWRPSGIPVATGVDEPLCWYPVHGIDSICADYGRGFVCCRAYEAVSGRTNITVDYVELESPSSLVATGRSVSIGVLHCSGFDPTGAEFLEAAKRADAWAKSNEGIGYAFSSRKSAQTTDGWSQTDNGDGSTTYTNGTDTATVKPHESGQGYGYEVKDQDGNVKGYGWAQTADEAAQKAKDSGQQQATASRTAGYYGPLVMTLRDEANGTAGDLSDGSDVLFSNVTEDGRSDEWWWNCSDGYYMVGFASLEDAIDNFCDEYLVDEVVDADEAAKTSSYIVREPCSAGGFDGDSAWMEWRGEEAYPIDCRADRDGDAWHIAYALVDPMDPEDGGGMRTIMSIDRTFNAYDEEDEGSIVMNFMEANVPDLSEKDREEFTLREVAATADPEDSLQDILDEYGTMYDEVPQGAVDRLKRSLDAGLGRTGRSVRYISHGPSTKGASPSTVACTLGDGTTVTLVSEPERDDIYVDIFNSGRYTSRVVAMPADVDDVVDAITDMAYSAYPRILDPDLLGDGDWDALGELCGQALEAMVRR